MKPLKTFEETLTEEMKDPEFREEFLKASTELNDEFAKLRKPRETAELSQQGTAARMEPSQSSAGCIEAELPIENNTLQKET